MNVEERHGKHADHEERVQAVHFPNLPTSRQELGHETWGVEWGSGLKNNADMLAGIVEGGDLVGQLLRGLRSSRNEDVPR